MKILRPEVAISQPDVGPEVLKSAYFVPSDLRNQFYEVFWTGSGLFYTESRTGSDQKLHILANLTSDINLMKLFVYEADIFQQKVLKNSISEVRNQFMKVLLVCLLCTQKLLNQFG